MTYKAKLATIATVALLAGIVTMFLLHAYGPHPSFGFNGTFPMTGMWDGMGWMMLLGPLAMILSFGGFVTLIILLVTILIQSLAKPD